MKMRSRRWSAGLLGLAVLLTVAVTLRWLRPLPVEVAGRVETQPIEVFGLGTIEARIVSKLGFEVGAALVALNADHGDRVQAGETLARLHSGEQEARLARARAGVVHAEAASKMAEADVGKAKAVLAQKQQANRRQQALVARQTASAETAEEAQMEEDVAAAELTVALSNVQVAKAVLEDALAQVEFESVLLAHHTLRAPYDAVVVERHRELGTVLVPGEPVFTLVAPETVWALAYVDESRAGRLQVGQPAEIRLRSLPGERFPAHVARIGIESDRVSEERRVYVACDRCPERFHLGEQAEVFITIAEVDQALFVPVNAVDEFAAGDDPEGWVWSVEEDTLRRRRVRFGHRTLDGRLEIASEMPAGARVVVARHPGLREGRAVRIAEETSG